MRSLIVLAALLACAMSAKLPRLPADVLLSGSGKIVNGTEVRPNSLPFQVRLENANTGGLRCGGSIINETTILCAAHCGGFPLGNYRIVAGDHNSNVTEGTEQRRGITSFYAHPNYNSNTNVNDIALILLDAPLTWTPEVQPIKLPDQTNTDVPAGTIVTVSGWGTTEEGGQISDVLRSVQVPVVADSDCNRSYPLTNIVSSMICAGDGSADSCQGDSGGPLFTGSGANATQWGIVSFGRGCSRDRAPGVYTEMTYFTNWVRGV